MHITLFNTKPTGPGYYLCVRPHYSSKPEFVEIRQEEGRGLVYIGKMSTFPLSELEETARFSSLISFEYPE